AEGVRLYTVVLMLSVPSLSAIAPDGRGSCILRLSPGTDVPGYLMSLLWSWIRHSSMALCHGQSSESRDAGMNIPTQAKGRLECGTPLGWCRSICRAKSPP